MKTVYIVRHAKSSWDNPLQPDEKRPLLEKGRKRTKKVIDLLHRKNIRLDHLICSHAVRALETAQILARALGFPEEDIRIDTRIYKTDGVGLFFELFDLPNQSTSAMIVGHNPALTDFVNRFLMPQTDNLPTSGVVSISFETDRWEDLRDAEFRVNFFINPKLIDGHEG